MNQNNMSAMCCRWNHFTVSTMILLELELMVAFVSVITSWNPGTSKYHNILLGTYTTLKGSVGFGTLAAKQSTWDKFVYFGAIQTHEMKWLLWMGRSR